jgi:hypothetical protein
LSTFSLLVEGKTDGIAYRALTHREERAALAHARTDMNVHSM